MSKKIDTDLLSNQLLIICAFSALPHSMHAILEYSSAIPLKRQKTTYPLLFPFTLCSENVISLWSRLIPAFSATWRRSSSVVHYRAPHLEIYAHSNDTTVQTHCKSPIYKASSMPPPIPFVPIIVLFTGLCAGFIAIPESSLNC